jgi:hypothetical protein
MDSNRLPSMQSLDRPRDGPRRRAQVIQLAAYRQRVADTERDRILDAEWDRLAVLVAEALCWRDPESVTAVGACVARLEPLVRADWGVG